MGYSTVLIYLAIATKAARTLAKQVQVNMPRTKRFTASRVDDNIVEYRRNAGYLEVASTNMGCEVNWLYMDLDDDGGIADRLLT